MSHPAVALPPLPPYYSKAASGEPPRRAGAATQGAFGILRTAPTTARHGISGAAWAAED
jgi:hypothetical protein